METATSHPAIDDEPDGRPPQTWQGIPGVAETADGSLWITWYTGGPKEPDARNVVVLERSDDGGATWTRVCMIGADGSTRAFDPSLWVDPTGRLWHIWNQSDEGVHELFDGRGGVWARHAEVEAGQAPEWSPARRLSNGVSMNKPIVTDAGDWLLPASVWAQGPLGRTDEPRDANVYASSDGGVTWSHRGGASVHPSDRTFDEHMVVQLPSGHLWMLIRTLSGLAESFSTDGGASWTLARPSGFGPHTSSRVFFATLRNGDIVLIRNSDRSRRDGLSIWRSRDAGASWSLAAVIDERPDLTYPDATQLADGRLAVVYDRDRLSRGEIVLRFVDVEGSMSVTEPIVVSVV